MGCCRWCGRVEPNNKMHDGCGFSVEGFKPSKEIQEAIEHWKEHWKWERMNHIEMVRRESGTKSWESRKRNLSAISKAMKKAPSGVVVR